MQEEFVYLKEKNFEDCQISNFGTVISSKGKIVKPYYKNKCLNIDIKKIKNKKVIDRLVCSVSQLVYKYFGKDVPNCDFKVRHIDGNVYNLRIDNLKIYETNKTQQQIEVYNKLVIPTCKHIFFNSSYAKDSSLDIDNILGNAYMFVWKYLGNYDITKSFYIFCLKYVKVACITEYKNSRKFGITGILNFVY